MQHTERCVGSQNVANTNVHLFRDNHCNDYYTPPAELLEAGALAGVLAGAGAPVVVAFLCDFLGLGGSAAFAFCLFAFATCLAVFAACLADFLLAFSAWLAAFLAALSAFLAALSVGLEVALDAAAGAVAEAGVD
jgi:hypothetical protein